MRCFDILPAKAEPFYGGLPIVNGQMKSSKFLVCSVVALTLFAASGCSSALPSRTPAQVGSGGEVGDRGESIPCGDLKIPTADLAPLREPTCIAYKSLQGTVDQAWIAGKNNGLEIKVFERDRSTDRPSLVGTIHKGQTGPNTLENSAFREVCGLSLLTAKIINRESSLIFFDNYTTLKVSRAGQSVSFKKIASFYDPEIGYPCGGKSPGKDSYDVELAKGFLNFKIGRNDSEFKLSDILSASSFKSASIQAVHFGRYGYTCKDLTAAGYDIWELKLMLMGPSTGFYSFDYLPAQRIKDFGCDFGVVRQATGDNPKMLLDVGYSLKELTQVYSVQDLADKKIHLPYEDIKSFGYQLAQLREVRWRTGDDYHRGYWDSDLKSSGYSAREFMQAGCQLHEFKKSKLFSGQELVKEGFSCSELKSADYDLIQRRGCNN